MRFTKTWIGWGHMLAGKTEAEEVLTCPFHLPVNINGEEGNHCHSSRYSTKPPDCILDSDMPFFFLQGNQMFLHSVTDSLPDCPKPSIHPPPQPSPHVFESNSSSVPVSVYPFPSQFALRWISVYSSGGWLKSESNIALQKEIFTSIR